MFSENCSEHIFLIFPYARWHSQNTLSLNRGLANISELKGKRDIKEELLILTIGVRIGGSFFIAAFVYECTDRLIIKERFFL